MDGIQIKYKKNYFVNEKKVLFHVFFKNTIVAESFWF